MYRTAIEKLYQWKESKRRKPLIIEGARQVGKTWLAKEFGSNDLFTEFKSALTEQYVCQQLKTIDNLNVYYYTNDRGSCEIDFVIDTGEQIVPVKVKAEVNLKSKSLKTYREKFSSEICIRASMADYKKENRLVNLPLYVVGIYKLQFIKPILSQIQ